MSLFYYASFVFSTTQACFRWCGSFVEMAGIKSYDSHNSIDREGFHPSNWQEKSPTSFEFERKYSAMLFEVFSMIFRDLKS